MCGWLNLCGKANFGGNPQGSTLKKCVNFKGIMNSQNRKRASITLKEKRNHVKAFRKSGLTQNAYAESAGIRRSTLTASLRVENFVKDLDSDDPVLSGNYVDRTKESGTRGLDEYILGKLEILRTNGARILKQTLVSLAKEYFETIGSNVIVTDHLIRMFKLRNKVAYKRIFGEEKSVAKDQIYDWFKEFNIIRKEYDDNDIFNFDETAIFVKMPGNYSYVMPNDTRKGSKLDKTRLTIGFCFNRVGTEICPMLIGRSANPRVIKKYDFYLFNLHDFSRKNACCTREIFIRWLEIVKNPMRLVGRKILIVCDNFSGHKVNNLSHIKIHLLPPNTTSILQPLDLGPISTFKTNYQAQLADFINDSILNEQLTYAQTIKKISLYEMCRWMRISIDSVPNAAFEKCFDKFLNFDYEKYMNEEENEDKNPLQPNLERLQTPIESLPIEDVLYLPEKTNSFDDTKWHLDRLEYSLGSDRETLDLYYMFREQVLKGYKK